MAVSLATESVVAVAVALALAFLTANQPADNKNMHNNCPETGMMMPIPNDDANRCRWVECSSSTYEVARLHPSHRHRHMAACLRRRGWIQRFYGRHLLPECAGVCICRQINTFSSSMPFGPGQKAKGGGNNNAGRREQSQTETVTEAGTEIEMEKNWTILGVPKVGCIS